MFTRLFFWKGITETHCIAKGLEHKWVNCCLVSWSDSSLKRKGGMLEVLSLITEKISQMLSQLYMQIDHSEDIRGKRPNEWSPNSSFNHIPPNDPTVSWLLYSEKLLRKQDKGYKPTLCLIRSLSNRSRIMSSKQEERLQWVTQHCCAMGQQLRFQDEEQRTFNRPLSTDLKFPC